MTVIFDSHSQFSSLFMCGWVEGAVERAVLAFSSAAHIENPQLERISVAAAVLDSSM